MPPEVTAVVTTHGRPARVREALASLRAETHRDVEIVVVDDGGEFPADDTPRIVRGVRLGIARARNLGLAAARGEFVIFLDDDDVALPHRISSLVRAARIHDASLCFGMTRRVFDGTSRMLESVPTHVVSSGAVGFSDLLTCAPHVNAVLARTEVLRAVGGFDAGAAHFDDWSAWLRVANDGGVIRSIARTVAEWRLHDDGLTGRILEQRAMKPRLQALFDRLQPCLSAESARAVAAARRIVASAGILEYDDYADAMAAARFTRSLEPAAPPSARRPTAVSAESA